MPEIIKTLFLILITGQVVFAQTERPPLSTDRPDQTEAPVLVPVKYFQIETGFVFETGKTAEVQGDTYTDSYNLGTSLLRYGLSKKVELRLGAGFTLQKIQEGKVISEESGLANVLLASKISLAEEEGFIPQSALLLNLFLPIGNKSFFSDNLVPGFVFATGYTLTQWLGMSSNLGMRFFENDDQIFRYSLVFGFDVIPKIGIFLETFGRISGKDKPVHMADLGMTYRILPNLQLDTSYGLALNDVELDQFFNFGASIRFPR